MRPPRLPRGQVRGLLIALLLLAACATGEAEPPAPTVDPSVAAEVEAIRGTFGAYRAGVAAGAPGAVLDTVTSDSVAWFGELGDLARTATADAVRGLPATAQLLVLTLRDAGGAQLTELDDGEAVLSFLVEGRYAGQDRSLGGLGDITLASEDLALGVVTRDGVPTPLRWRFDRVDGQWRYDLLDALGRHDDAIARGAASRGLTVPDVVAETLQRLTGEAPADALYTPAPGMGA